MSRYIFDEFKDKLKTFILKRVSHPQDAEDLLQEVFLKIHSYEGALEEIDRMESWIYQITRNTIIDYYRKKGRKQEISMNENIEGTLEEKADTEDNLNDVVSNWIKEMIQSLPAHDRQALILTEFQNYKQKELADELGLSLSGAKSRVQRARKRLKKALQECCHLELDSFGNVLEYEQKQSHCSYCQKTDH
ncbi:MAG: RNA polymerase sigma factor SigZ [Bacillaceae bacterium]|nr:RNA polymerase sigma factor SigZ [Bacillaceae bacterium]